MQANLAHFQDVAALEDDILCFLPTVSDLEVFGCELELLDLREQQPLSEAFRTVLLQRPQLQIVVRPCMVEGHSIWHFQTDVQRRLPQSSACPGQPERANCRQSLLRSTFNPTRRSGNASNTQELRPGRVASNCRLSSFQLRSSVWRKGLSWGAVCCVRSLHQGVSTVDKGCLQSAVP